MEIIGNVILSLMIGILFLIFGIILSYAFIFEPSASIIRHSKRYGISISIYNSGFKNVILKSLKDDKRIKPMIFDIGHLSYIGLNIDKVYILTFELECSDINHITDITNNIETEIDFMLSHDSVSKYRDRLATSKYDLALSDINYNVISKRVKLSYTLFGPAIKSSLYGRITTKEENENLVINNIGITIKENKKLIEGGVNNE